MLTAARSIGEAKMHLKLKALKMSLLSTLVMLSVAACTQQSVEPEVQVNSIASSNSAPADITVTILGSGTPIPTADQFGASILVQAGGQDLLFDCGRGCTTRLVQVHRKLISGIENLFLTHLHSDHIVGVDDLWLNGWTQGRNEPLKVFGPTGTTSFFGHLKEAFREDINIRIKKGLPASTDGIGMAMTDLDKDGVVFDKDGVKVTAFLVDHQPVEPAFGFRIDYAGRSVIISGDTKPSENLIKYAKGADVILHEVMSPGMVNYIKTNFTDEQFKSIVGIHTTTEQAADIFSETKPRLAVYYHTRNTQKDIESLIDVTSQTYDGEVVVSKDLMQVSIGDEVKSYMLE